MTSIKHLDSQLNKIYDHLYANASFRTPSGIAKEVAKILRTIEYLERSSTGKKIIDTFSTIDKNASEKEKSLIIKRVSKNIKAAFNKLKKSSHVFSQGDKINLSDFDITYVCSNLAGIQITSNEKDVFGDALEIFRSHWSKSSGGQFFTDQRVTKLALSILQFNPYNGDDLVDICAGTGGFLLAGINKVTSLNKSSNKELYSLIKRSIKGQEIDKELCDIGNTTIASKIGKNNHSIVHQGNSILTEDFNSSSNRISYNSHCCIATNPPFGTKITIKDLAVLSNYELAQSKTTDALLEKGFGKLVPRSPDTLFIEQNIKLLKPGYGRLAIVIPYQIASGPQTIFVREWLLKNSQIIAVVDLPPDTFQPHTGTKACLLVVKRRKKPLLNLSDVIDPPIFMSVPKSIGHDRRGNPIYEKDNKGNITDKILSDFDAIEKAYDEFLNKNNPSKVHPESFIIQPKNIYKDKNIRFNAKYYVNTPHKLSLKKNKTWSVVKLRDVVENIFYPGRFARDYVENSTKSVPFLGGTNISQLIINTDKRLSLNNPRLKELTVKPGWILITRSGSTGIVAIVPENWNGYTISEHVIRIIPDNKKMPSEYLYAFLRTAYAQDVLKKGVYGSVIDEITPNYIADIDIPFPKSKELLNKIVQKIKKGEDARNVAINFLNDGVDTLEKLLF